MKLDRIRELSDQELIKFIYDITTGCSNIKCKNCQVYKLFEMDLCSHLDTKKILTEFLK